MICGMNKNDCDTGKVRSKIWKDLEEPSRRDNGNSSLTNARIHPLRHNHPDNSHPKKNVPERLQGQGFGLSQYLSTLVQGEGSERWLRSDCISQAWGTPRLLAAVVDPQGHFFAGLMYISTYNPTRDR
jgi:hypothetical protein